MPHEDESQNAAANRLYWESDASVAEIARRLSVSRRALYDAVRPERADVRCPDCGMDLVFRTRTARMLGEAECPRCGLEHDVEELGQTPAEAGPAPAAAGPAVRRPEDESEPAEVADEAPDADSPSPDVRTPSPDTDAPSPEAEARTPSPEADAPPPAAGPPSREEPRVEPAARAGAGDDEPVADAADWVDPADEPVESPFDPDRRGDGWPGEAEGLEAESDPWREDPAAMLGLAAIAGVVVGAIAIWLGTRR